MQAFEIEEPPVKKGPNEWLAPKAIAGDDPVIDFRQATSYRVGRRSSPLEIVADAGNSLMEATQSILQAPKSAGTFYGTIANMVKSNLGSAFLSIPDAFKFGSILPSLFSFILAWWLSLFTMNAIVKLCVKHNVKTYRGLWTATVDRKTAWLCDVFIVLNSTFSCTAYCLLTGTWVTTGLVELVGNPFKEVESFIIFNMMVIVWLVFTPLCMQRDLHALRHVSMVGVCCTLVGVAFVTIEALLYWGIKLPNRKCGATEGCTTTQVLTAHLFHPTWQLGLVFDMCCGMLLLHYNIPKFFAEYHSQEAEEFNKTTFTGTVISTSIGCFMAVVSIMRFGTDFPDGNVLSRFDGLELSVVERKVTMVIWLVMAANVSANFPLLFQPMRSSFLQLCGSSVEDLSSRAYLAVTLSLLAFNVVCGLVVPNLTVIMKFKGSICGIGLSFILPGAMLWGSLRHSEARSKSETNMAIVVFATGILLCLYGVVDGIVGVIDLSHQNATGTSS